MRWWSWQRCRTAADGIERTKEAPLQKSPVIVIGLDAFDPCTALGFAEDGQLPNIARLLENGARARVCNPFGLYVGAAWANFTTCLRPDRHGFHCWNRIEIETYRHRLSPPRFDGFPTFWKTVADSGRRVAIVDVPHARLEPGLNGVQVVEWGCHDRHWGLCSWPPGKAKEIVATIGTHPVLGIPAITHEDFAPDDYVHRAGALRTAQEEGKLLDGLIEGAAAKARLLSDLLADEEWDLVVGIFGEAHAGGHQLWHLHDHAHPRFDASVAERLGGDPILTLYRAVDAGVGEVVAKAGPDALICLLMSHGMGPHHDGVHMLDELLSRLDSHHFGSEGRRSVSASAPLRAAIPGLRRLASRLGVPLSIRERVGRLLDERTFSTARARQHYFLEPNNYVYGGIRLNLVGREPDGCVAPEDFDRVCAQLEEDLLELVNLDTGRPAVRAVIRSDTRHRRSPRDVMPDLFVDWNREAPIERVSSPKIGILHSPYDGWRTGDHRDDGLLIVHGRGFAAGSEYPDIDMEDIGASIAARFDVALGDIDGRPADWLARNHEKDPAACMSSAIPERRNPAQAL
ncbi:alkaline phosphatase family protein [Sphingosinicella rhizophila]|uniref:Alkaline phosphatase family protein n=1 Tax=Sphingosinicella rhizophila TaxID=3050082 RepID=A0ABU3Q8R4_9SPHN|nr:alkaline phosphatase family protein [Sphingosinicella sp. GR2756]MDT9599796.1 alkaline phosphatase family protein [Sphingosinicella sp. GR2756]